MSLSANVDNCIDVDVDVDVDAPRPLGLAGLSPNEMPFVTLCTPTFNRRPFFDAAKSCVIAQTYPRHRMEWLIVDDGTDPVGDLFDGGDGTGAHSELLPTVRYVYSGSAKMPLGAKRNLTNALARGDILVYWDDDDYYPPCRVAHAVDALLKNPGYRIAGAKSIHVYYQETQQVHRYGPYASSPEFASAATFAFRRTYDRRFDPLVSLSEENAFTADFSEPMLALDPLQTILVFAHDQNSYDKRWALFAETHNGHFGRTDLAVADFVRPASAADWALVASSSWEQQLLLQLQQQQQLRICDELRAFYVSELTVLLKAYTAGSVVNKPDIVATLERLGLVPAKVAAELAEQRAAVAASMEAAAEPASSTESSPTTANSMPGYCVSLQSDDGSVRALTLEEVIGCIEHLYNSGRYAERERQAISAERDSMAAQAEHWKQECVRLKAAAAVANDGGGGGGGGDSAAPKKRKYGLQDYERCIAELVCARSPR